MFLTACTTITYPDGTKVCVPYLPQSYGYTYGYGGGYPVYSNCGEGVYTGGYFPVYGHCYGSGWNSWGGWEWINTGGYNYANNIGNTSINVNRTTTYAGSQASMTPRVVSRTYATTRTLPAGGLRGMR